MTKTLNIPSNLHMRLKIAAARARRSAVDVASEAITGWLAVHEGDAPAVCDDSQGPVRGRDPSPAIRARVLAAVSSCAGRTRRACAAAAGVCPTTFNAHFAALEREGVVSLAEGRVSVAGVAGGSY